VPVVLLILLISVMTGQRNFPKLKLMKLIYYQLRLMTGILSLDNEVAWNTVPSDTIA
jgi:hypothetical protein